MAIAGETDMAGFAVALNASLVVVACPSLGTLNHTALTLEAAARRGLAVEMLVVSDFPAQPGTVEQENLRFFRARYPDLPLITLAHAPLTPPDPLAGLAPRLLGPLPPLLREIGLA